MKRIALLTAVILLVIAAIAVVWQLHAVVLIFLLSLAIAATLGQPIEYLYSRGWRRGVAIGTVYVLAFGLSAGAAGGGRLFCGI